MAVHPFGQGGADHPFAAARATAVSGDHQNDPEPACLRPDQKAGQHILGLEPAMPMQVQTRLDRLAFAGDAAMTTGVKSSNGTIGVTQDGTPGNCALRESSAADSLWEIAEDAGLATGFVSTARITHATPAATFAKTVDRDWEADVNLSPAARAASTSNERSSSGARNGHSFNQQAGHLGASPWQRFWNITLPMLMPILAL